MEGSKTQPEGKKALVTIVTPFYQAGSRLKQTFEAVTRQTFPWFAWLIVDDGSADTETEILSRYVRMDERISVYRQKHRGAAKARHAGLRLARTEIVVLLDAGDMPAPQYLEYTYFGLYFHKDAAWCDADAALFKNREYRLRKQRKAKTMLKDYELRSMAAVRKRAYQECPERLKGYLCGPSAAKRTQNPYYRPESMEQWDDYCVWEKTKQRGDHRVLMLVPWMVMGGADKFNLDLTAGLTRRGYRISILTTVPSENEWQSHFLNDTDEIFHLPDFLDPEHYVEFVSYYIRTRKIRTLFVSNSYLGYYMLPLLRKQFPDLCIADYVHMEEWYWKDGGFARLSGVFGSLLDQTYVCNSATRQVMIRCFQRHPQSVDTMYIGVDEQRFDPKRVTAGCLYQKLNISKKRPIILFPCRICAQKRPFLMLAIARKVCEKRPDALFVVAGDGPQKEALKRAIIRRRMRKNVVCIGKTEHMPLCYQDASVTLICSVKEGLSLTAYESCAMATPVVSSDVGGQKDLIDDSVGKLIRMRQKESSDFDNKTYDPKEVKEYADAILKLLSDPQYYQTCSTNCRRKIVQGFTTDRLLSHMERELEKLQHDQAMIKKRHAKSFQLQQAGRLPEELYRLELAEEACGRGAFAVFVIAEKMMERLLPQGSSRRELALRLYKNWRDAD